MPTKPGDCIFCQIAAGKLPACRVYEDAETLAFLDIAPLIPGHTLVIPRRHYDPLTDTPPEVLARLIAAVRLVARAQFRGLRADGVNVMQTNGQAAGQVVPHIHFHVIPRFLDDGHSWNWRARSYARPEEMQRLAAAIQQALEPREDAEHHSG